MISTIFEFTADAGSGNKITDRNFQEIRGMHSGFIPGRPDFVTVMWPLNQPIREAGRKDRGR